MATPIFRKVKNILYKHKDTQDSLVLIPVSEDDDKLVPASEQIEK